MYFHPNNVQLHKRQTLSATHSLPALKLAWFQTHTTLGALVTERLKCSGLSAFWFEHFSTFTFSQMSFIMMRTRYQITACAVHSKQHIYRCSCDNIASWSSFNSRSVDNLLSRPGIKSLAWYLNRFVWYVLREFCFSCPWWQTQIVEMNFAYCLLLFSRSISLLQGVSLFIGALSIQPWQSGAGD